MGNKIKRAFVKVKFPDARFRFTGKDYVYEIPAGTAPCNIPKERDFIRIHELKDLHGKESYCPAYSEKDLLVTESIAFESEDDIDAQVYFGIGTWKVIQKWEISKRFEEKASADLSNLLDGGAAFEREKVVIHNLENEGIGVAHNLGDVVQNLEGECLKNAEPLTPLVDYKIKGADICSLISDAPIFVKAGETYSGELNFGNDMKMVFDRGSLFLIKNNGETEKVLTEKVEEKNMNKNMFSGIMKNFQFGKVDTDKIAYSMNGMAFKNQNGDYVVYNADGTATNVSTLAFQMPLFAMPTALANIAAGDVIVHNKENEYVVVKEVTKTAIVAIAPDRNEIVTIVPQKSIFGFDFYTKIVSPMAMMAGNATNDNPFGNILPFMLMGDGEMDKDTMLMLAMCNGGAANQNMILPLLMMGDKDNDNTVMIAMALMMGGQNPFAPQGNVTND